MPTKNSIKIYKRNAFYHVFNRGFEKSLIFIEDEDYIKFLSILDKYLLPKLKRRIPRTNKYEKIHNPRSMSGSIAIYAFCLMPNHFHLLLKQKGEKHMCSFVKKVVICYALYFNKKYKRSGALFQNRYQASLLATSGRVQDTISYIENNAVEAGIVRKKADYKWVSCNYKKRIKWLRSHLL